MKLFLAALFSILGLLPTLSAQAQGDLVWSERVFTLPPPPGDFRTDEVDSVRWDYPPATEDEVRELQALRRDAWPMIEEDLGVDVDDAITVRIARSPEEMRALAPRGLGVPSYATGVAYPHLGVIILSLDAPGNWEPPDLAEVFVHELSHVALRRAVGGADMPRWFVEGMAIFHADERSLDRFQVLARAHLADEQIPLHMLDGRFPERVHEVSLAYAEAADVVTFLRREERGRSKMHRLIFELGEGRSFDDALMEAYSLSPQQLEREWTAELESRMSSIPMLVGGSTFWVLAAFLLILAWRRRRRDAKAKLEAMAAEESDRDEAIARLERLVEQQLADDGPRILVSGDPPQGREPGVPTIEVDGSNHTLH
ncbi:MAG: peptidase MA family metallohydrolase [Myxococcota bacterium]